MGQLRTLELVRERRLEKAQRALYGAVLAQKKAQEEFTSAKAILADFVERLPGIVEVLFRPVMNKPTDVPVIGEILQEELQLTKKVAQLEKEVLTKQTSLEAANAQVEAARAALMACERKKLALDELVKQDNVVQYRTAQKQLGKVLDEFSGNRYVAKMC